MAARIDDALRAVRDSALDDARGALLMALFGGAITYQDYQRLDDELCQAAEIACATRH